MRMDLLDIYTDYLIVSRGQTTATGLSRLSDETISHDEITRMLAGRQATRKDLWKAVKPLVRHVQSEDAVLIIDDTIAPKPHSDENEIICWHWDHTQKRSVKGIGLLSLLYHSHTTALPLAVEIIAKTETYTEAKTAAIKRRSPQTKNEHMRQMLGWAKTLRLQFSYVLADSWYASAENMDYIHTKLQRHFVFAIKGNRKVARSAEQKRRGSYCTVEALQIEANRAVRVYLEGVPFPLVLARYAFTDEDGAVRTLHLISNQTTLKATTLLRVYKRRWTIEQYHKSLKQNTSLLASPTRRRSTQSSHLFAAVLAFVKLESLKLATKLNHFALKQRIYLTALTTAMEELSALKARHPNIPTFA